MSLFGVIVTHYQGTQTDEEVVQCVQDYGDQEPFPEIHVMHDGPFLRVPPKTPFPVMWHATEKRFDDSGHTLRDRGMRWCGADYIIHTNADNRLFPGALAKIAEKLPADGVIFGIRLMRKTHNGIEHGRTLQTDEQSLVGRFHIDAMQLVMRRDLWLAEGGWSDKSTESDGILYGRFNEKYTFERVHDVLGEHW